MGPALPGPHRPVRVLGLTEPKLQPAPASLLQQLWGVPAPWEPLCLPTTLLGPYRSPWRGDQDVTLARSTLAPLPKRCPGSPEITLPSPSRSAGLGEC